MPKRDLQRKLNANPVKVVGAGVTGGTAGGTITNADTLNSQYPAFYLSRANHTGTQTAATISDFDTEVSNNTDVAANTAARHAAVTVTDTTSVDFTLTGQALSAVVLPAGVDHNSLLNYSANKHVDHTGVTLTAGNGLIGGGTIAASRTFAVGAGNGITVNADDVALASTTAGAGLTFTTGVLAVGAGDGIDVAADSVAVDVTDFIDTAAGLKEDASNNI